MKNGFRYFRIFFLITVLFSSLIYAEEPLPNYTEPLPQAQQKTQQEMPYFFEEPPAPTEETSFLAQFFYMLFMLGLLIAIVFFTSWFLRRMVSTRIEQLNATSEIKISEKRALSNRTTLYLIEVEGKKMFLAETASSIIQIKLESSESL